MRTIDVSNCEVVGKGGMSVVYRLDCDRVAKVFRRGISLEVVNYEYSMSQRVYRFGIPTPLPYEVVAVADISQKEPVPITDACQYAIVYQYLDGDTLSAAITAHPERIEDYAHQFADFYKSLHSIKVTDIEFPADGMVIPDAHVLEADAIRKIAPIFGDDGAERLLQILDNVPRGNSLLHCDFHPRNVMLHEGRLMLIDVSEMGYGNPLLDLAHTHALMASGLLDFQRFVGFPQQYARPFWDTVLADYFCDEASCSTSMEEIERVSLIRCFTWLAVPEGLPSEVIDRFRGHFRRLVRV